MNISNQAKWFAIGEMLSEWDPRMTADQVLEQVEMNTDDVIFWEPFEHWDGEAVAAAIQNLAFDTQALINSVQGEPLVTMTKAGNKLDYSIELSELDKLSDGASNKEWIWARGDGNLNPLYTSPQPIEKCEPVAEALHERNRLGYAVVNVIGTLDEIIENAQEVEVDDFLHIAIPIDKWHELQDALEEMPKRAELYTSPISKEWVDVPYEERRELYKSVSKGNIDGFADLLSARLKQLNAEKG